MATNVAVSLFLQRMLHEKYMEDSVVDSLIQSIIRGTGISFNSKSAFIEYINKMLSDIRFMLVRVNVAGKKYYSLKDLDSNNTAAESLEHLENHSRSPPDELNELDFRTPVRNLAEKLGNITDFSQNSTSSVYPYPSMMKLNPSKFTHSELMIFIGEWPISHKISECINAIIFTGKPLPLKKQGAVESWSTICSRKSVLEDSSQLNLFQRFERKKWLEFYEGSCDIAPGVRFYFDLAGFFDLRRLSKCESCSTVIMINEFICQECKNSFHTECGSSKAQGSMEGEGRCFTCSIT